MSALLILATVVMLVGNVTLGWGIPVILALLPLLIPVVIAVVGFAVAVLAAALFDA